MTKHFIYIILAFIIAAPAFAEKIPIRLAPVQIISTHHDEIEVGDKIEFETVNDVYIDNNIYIKRNTRIVGIVDFIHPNGWGGDAADIVFKTFYTKDINNKKVTITYPLDINGNSERTNDIKNIAFSRANNFMVYLTEIPHFAFIFRGSEIFIEPDTRTYNIFIEK